MICYYVLSMISAYSKAFSDPSVPVSGTYDAQNDFYDHSQQILDGPKHRESLYVYHKIGAFLYRENLQPLIEFLLSLANLYAIRLYTSQVSNGFVKKISPFKSELKKYKQG
jgi:hypothetical protein